MIFTLSPIPSIDYSVILAKRGSKAATPAFEKVRSIGMTHLAGQDYFYTGKCINVSDRHSPKWARMPPSPVNSCQFSEKEP